MSSGSRICDRRSTLMAAALLTAGLAAPRQAWSIPGNRRSGKVNIDGLRVYYEVHGRTLAPGTSPIVLLHGGSMTIETAFKPELVERFARARPVIAIEQQGHGHTGDRPGPMTVDRMVADTAALLNHLNVARADLFGHSLGGIIATGMAIRHPALARSVTTLGAPYKLDGFLPDIVRMQLDPTIEPPPALIPLLPTEVDFAAWRASYKRGAPDPTAFDATLARLNTMLAKWEGWTEAELRSVRMPFFVAVGDNDFVRIEHAVEMARLIPNARLAILPGTTHMGIVNRSAWLHSMMDALLRPVV
jgi:pimeloyl-ACP methyl ester carboxylesterase